MSDDIDGDRLARWIADTVDPAVRSATPTRLGGGHSSGAWRIDTDGETSPLVLKVSDEPSVVFRRDIGREGRVLQVLHEHGAPVPRVVQIDHSGDRVGRPCFAMELVSGRGLADGTSPGYHDDPILQALPVEQQRSVWESFYDALGAMHSVDPDALGDVGIGPTAADTLDYWRSSLLDVVAPTAVPRQLAVLDWLESNLPGGADDAPALCMGDARFANAIVDDARVRALVDFEVAYIGNPAADVAYSVAFDTMQRESADPVLPGAGTPDDAWARWSARTGRPATDREYWTAFGLTIVVVTATRAMVQWGLAGDDLEAANPFVQRWEAAVDDVERVAR